MRSPKKKNIDLSVSDYKTFIDLSGTSSPKSEGELKLQIEKMLGEGSFAKVYKRYDPKTRQFYAVKFFDVYPEQHIHFSIEAFFLFVLSNGSPHILKYHGAYFSEVDKFYAIQTELMDGSLHQLISSDRKLKPCEIVKIGSDIARGLKAIHDAGCVHFDFTSKNILYRNIAGKIQVKVGDLQSVMPYGKQTIGEFLDSDVFHGAPVWMAPELNRKDRSRLIDSSLDIFSLGVILLELATRKTALCDLEITSPTDATLRLAYSLLENPEERLKRYVPLVTSGHLTEFIELIIDCMRLSSEERPDINQVISRLESIEQLFELSEVKAVESETKSSASSPSDEAVKAVATKSCPSISRVGLWSSSYDSFALLYPSSSATAPLPYVPKFK